MPANRCCVLECDSPRDIIKHAFPKIDKDFQEWVQRSGNPILKDLSKSEIHRKYAICRNHFDESCLSPGTKRLNFRSLPTLHLPIDSLNLKTHNRPEIKENSVLQLDSNMTEDSQDSIAPLGYNDCDLASILNLDSTTASEDLDDLCSYIAINDGSPLSDKSEDKPSEKCSYFHNLNADGQIEMPRIQITKCSGILHTISVTRKSQLTPASLKLYEEVKKLKRQNQRLKMQSLNYKTRYKNTKKKLDFEILADKVNSVTYKFFLSQMRNQQKKSNGQRFTDDDKKLALSIYKQSPKVYKYLSTIFSLPTRKTIGNMLRSLRRDTVNNKHLKEHK